MNVVEKFSRLQTFYSFPLFRPQEQLAKKKIEGFVNHAIKVE